jgi:hypothetical protein
MPAKNVVQQDMKLLCSIACSILLFGCAGSPRDDAPLEKSTSGNGGKVVGAVGGAGAGAAMGYSSAGLLCTLGGPLCLIVVIPAAIVGGVVGLAAGGVVDAVSAGPRPQEGPPPADTSALQGG